jgi:N-methylhydantoinase A/oxoprolinase/acetone carboxylase beta subunit
MQINGKVRIGIDVGGTNTDGVVMQGRRVLHGLKTGTTDDVMGGVLAALRQLLDGAGVSSDAVAAVMIGTTQFTNALVERRRLAPVGLIRVALPATRGVPPLSGWPADMVAAVPIHWRMVQGGHEFDGRELSALNLDAVRQAAREFAAAGVQDVAISAAFSFINDGHERTAEAAVREVMPGASITLSSQIGRAGLLERENAAILNAALGPLGRQVVAAFAQALRDSGIGAPFYLTQNDGTLMDAAQAARFPILTVASGPTNSMRGAAFLSGLRDAIVVDIGGTTTDVGVLQAGFPRQAGLAVDVGGVRTNFRMPDVHSVGLGGGSVVSSDLRALGPHSVGWRIGSEALVFGGRTVTATDIAVASGVAQLGDASKAAHLPADAVQRCHQRLEQMVDSAIERMRTSAQPLPVVVVGGGSILLKPQLNGTAITVPQHFGVANAVGAAMAQVSGEVDRVVSLADTTRDAAIAAVRADAEAKALAAGASPGSLEMVDAEDIPLAYLGGGATRIRVRVVGDLKTAETSTCV